MLKPRKVIDHPNGYRKTVYYGGCEYCGKYYEGASKKYCCMSCCIRDRYESKNRMLINNKLHQVIEGTIFSDASLRKTKINPDFHFIQTERSKEYVEYVANEFSIELEVRKRIDKPTRFVKIPRTSYYFRTFATKDLLSYHDRWYPDGRTKIIPDDFEITPISLLHAYLGDGYLRKHTSKKQKTHTYSAFCTDSFTLEDIERNFMKPLEEKHGIYTWVDWHYGKEREKRPRVAIRTKSMADFFNFLGPCPVKCFEYKWPVL